MYVKSTKAHAGELGGLATRSRELGAFFLLFLSASSISSFRARIKSITISACTNEALGHAPTYGSDARRARNNNGSCNHTQATTTQATTTRASREQARTANLHLRMRSEHARIGSVRIAERNRTGRQNWEYQQPAVPPTGACQSIEGLGAIPQHQRPICFIAQSWLIIVIGSFWFRY